MTLLMTESFDNGNSSPYLVLQGSSSVNTTGGVYNTGSGFIPANSTWGTNRIIKYFRPQDDATSNASINFSFWFKAVSVPTTGVSGGFPGKVVYVYDNRQNSVLFGMHIDIGNITGTAGKLILSNARNDSTYNHIDNSILPSVCDNQWHFIEFNGLVAVTGGYGYIWQDGKLACYYNGNLSYDAFTRFDSITFTNLVGTSCHYLIDDFVVWDQLGTGYTGINKGPTRLQTLRPVSDITSANAVSTGASNWHVLDDINQINASDYITISNTGNVVVEMSNVVDGTANVYGYINYMDVTGVPGYTSNVRIGNKFNTTYRYNVSQVYSTTNNQIYGIVENNFENGTPLTAANLNNLVISIEKITS